MFYMRLVIGPIAFEVTTTTGVRLDRFRGVHLMQLVTHTSHMGKLPTYDLRDGLLRMAMAKQEDRGELCNRWQ